MDQVHEFTVEKMCSVLEVSTSGYYKWHKSRERRSAKKSEVNGLIEYEYERSRATYGSPRITDELKDKGFKYSKSTIARRMKSMNLTARRKKKFKITTDSDHDYKVFKNVLNREFDVDQPGKVWVSDITYIRVSNYWMYLTTVIDLADRMVVGWSLSKNMSASNTVIQAFKNACKNRNPEENFLFHSDRGVQYACDEFAKLIKDHNGVQSMSRKGNCWDNAVAESFFKTIKVEAIYKYEILSSRQAYRIIFNYIDGWYNTLRRHSALNGMTPVNAFLYKSNISTLAA